MRKKSNRDQSAPTHMTDYERSKLLRVQENQERLRQLGIKKIANSLSSLVDSRKTKKTKKNPTTNIEIDATHFHEEVSGSVGAAKTFVDTSATKKNQSMVKVTMGELLLNKKGSQMQRDVLTKNATKPNSATTSISSGSRRKLVDEDEDDLRYQDLNERDREEVTVGELLLSTKGSQMQMGVLTKKATKPNSGTTSMSSRSRRKLIEDDDEDEDDLRYQDLNDRDREEVGYEDDENEDIEDDLRLQDVNEADGESFDDENENIDDFENDNNETKSDGSVDEFENEDVELEILQVPQSQKRTAISTTKKRGPTMMHNIHTREFDRREVIICNEYGQPIGPSTKENDVVGKFSRFLVQ